MKKSPVYFLIILFHCTISCCAQKLMQDTLIIHLNPVLVDSIHIPAKIDSVLDLREVDNPCLLKIDEIKKYVFIPVDRHIISAKPPAQVIHRALPFTQDSDTCISVGIRQLEFEKQTHFFFLNRSTLSASMQFRREGHETPVIIHYESFFDRFLKSPSLKESYQKNFESFIQNMAVDLSAYSRALPFKDNSLTDNHHDCPWNFLNSGSDIIYNFSGYIIDGYLYFSHPEIQKITLRAGGVLRYRNEEDFESLEYKLANDFLFYRLNRIAAIRFKSQLLLGINRWKDMDHVKHELYDAMIFDLSLAQSVHYFPINRKSLLFGIGIQESVYYIYSLGFRFQTGLLLQVGLQI